jgi:hypothetical protein
MLEGEKMKTDTSKGRVGNCRPAKRHVEIFQLRALKGENFGGCVGQCTAK